MQQWSCQVYFFVRILWSQFLSRFAARIPTRKETRSLAVFTFVRFSIFSRFWLLLFTTDQLATKVKNQLVSYFFKKRSFFIQKETYLFWWRIHIKRYFLPKRVLKFRSFLENNNFFVECALFFFQHSCSWALCFIFQLIGFMSVLETEPV